MYKTKVDVSALVIIGGIELIADFELAIIMSGSQEEVRSMLDVIELYINTGSKPAYFDSFSINGKRCGFDVPTKFIDDVDLSKKVTITAFGTYGRYIELNDIDIFRDMAVAAPYANFQAIITGYHQYNFQDLKCELKNCKLSIDTFFEAFEEVDQAWMDDCRSKLPLNKFKELFEIYGGDFNEDSYIEMLDYLMVCIFDRVDPKRFVSRIESAGCKTDLGEERIKEIIKNELPLLGVLSRLDFGYQYDGGETKEYIYDPIAKKYDLIPNTLYDMLRNVDINDVIKEGLEVQGLPADDTAIGNLSIEEAYEALGAAIGSDKEN